MSSVLVHQHRVPAEVRAAPSPRARLSGNQLRELSAQWRQRVGEDPVTARRIADALAWLAAHREAPGRAPSLVERLRAGMAGWMRT